MNYVGTNSLNLGTGAVTIVGTGNFSTVNVLANTLTVGGVISGVKFINNMGSGTLALTAANTYTAATSVGGNLAVTSLANGGANSNIGASTSAAANLVLNRGNLLYSGTGATTDRLFTIGNAGGTITSDGTGAMNFTGTGAAVATGTFTLTNNTNSGVSFGAAATATINVANTSSLAVGQTISGGNIPANTTIVQILDASRVVVSNSTTGTAGGNYSFGELNRTLTLSGTNAGNNTISAAMANTTSGTTTLGLTKAGSGKWILSGSNSYTGATTVNAGTLVISGQISNSSAVVIGAGGNLAYNSAVARTGSITLNGSGASRAVLSGTGAINTAITLDNVGDTLAPGNSPGLRAFGVGQSWESFTYEWETNDWSTKVAGANFDQINITGSLNLIGGSGDYLLDLISLTTLNAEGNVNGFDGSPQSWTILTTTTGITGFDMANWTILTSNFTSNPAWSGDWMINQVGNDLVLSYAAIPEPATTSTLLLGGLGLAVVLYRRRKR